MQLLDTSSHRVKMSLVSSENCYFGKADQKKIKR